MAGRVRVGTAYIDIKLGSFEQFKSDAERRAKEVAKRVADRMTKDIQDQVSGKGAGQKISEEVGATVAAQAARQTGRIRTAFNNVMNSAFGDVVKTVAGHASRIGGAIFNGIKNVPGLITKASESLGTFARNLGLTSFMAQNLGYQLSFLVTGPIALLVAGLGKIGFTAGLNLEQARASLAPFVGGLEAARKEIETLSRIAEKSPAFDTTQIIQYAKQLLAAGLTQKQTNALFQATSNIFTTYGLTVDQANLSFRAITQIMQKGKVQAEELTGQLGEQIPALKLLADAYGVTQDKIREMVTQGKISGTDFVNAMIKIGNTKQFVEGAGTSADTLKSKLQNLKEQVQNKLAVAFDKYLFPKLNDLADKYGPKVIKTFEKLGDKWLPKVADWVGKVAGKLQELKDKWDSLSPSVQRFIEKLALALIAAGPIILTLSKIASGVGAVASILSFMGTPVGIAVNAIAALGLVLYTNRKAIHDFFTETDTGREILNHLKAAFDKFVEFLDTKVKPVLKDLKQFTEDALKGFLDLQTIQGNGSKNSQAGGQGHTKDVDAAMVAPPSKTQEAFKAFRDLVQSISDIFVKSLKPAMEAVRGAMENMGLAVGKNVKSMDVFKATVKVLGAILGTVIAVMVGLASFVINLIAGIIRAATSLVGGIIKIFQGFFHLLQGLWRGNWEEIKQGAREIWDGIYMAVVGFIWDLIMAVVNAVVGFVKVILGWFEWLYDKLVGHSVVPDMVNAIISWILRLPGRILGIIAGMVSSVVGKFIELATGAINAVKDLAAKVADKAASIRGAILDKLRDAGSWLYDAGKKIVQGLIDGLGSMFGKLRDKAAEMAGKITPFLPGSPVKEGPLKVLNDGYAGKQIVKMVADGMGYTDPLVSAASYVASAAVPTVQQMKYGNGMAGVAVANSGGQSINIEVNVPAPVQDPADIATYTVRKLNTALATKGI